MKRNDGFTTKTKQHSTVLTVVRAKWRKISVLIRRHSVTEKEEIRMTQTQVQYLANLEQARHNRKTEELQERLLGSQQAANVGSFLRGASTYVVPKGTTQGRIKPDPKNTKGKKPSSGSSKGGTGKQVLTGGVATAIGGALKSAGPYAGAAAIAAGAAAAKAELGIKGLQSFEEEFGVSPTQLVDAGIVTRNQMINLANNFHVPRSNRKAIYSGWVDRYKQKLAQENMLNGGAS